MTELDAVNYLLGVLGTSPVGDLSNTNPEVAICQNAISNAITGVTSKGFWFNELYSQTVSPDPLDSDKILMTGWLKVLTTSPQYAILRGNGYMFDPINNTYSFDNNLIVDGVRLLDFTDLPESVQLAVQYYAAVQLCSTDLEDQVKLSEQKGFYTDAYVQVLNEDLEIKRRNIMRTPRVADALYRVNPLHRRRRYGPNFGGR